MAKEYRVVELHEHGSLKSYLLGTLFSLALTLCAYFLAVLHLLPSLETNLAVAILAIIQTWVLLSLFLGLGKESKPRWNSLLFLFMVLVTVILVFGSLWIMYHLNYNMTMPEMRHD